MAGRLQVWGGTCENAFLEIRALCVYMEGMSEETINNLFERNISTSHEIFVKGSLHVKSIKRNTEPF